MSEAIRSERMGQTTISLNEDVADRLYDRKGRGESYNDVVVELLAIADRVESAPENAPESADVSGDVSGGDGSTSQPPGEGETRSAAPHDGEKEATLSETVDAVADDVLPGSGSKLEARRAALHAVVEYLREHDTATPSDFERDVYPDHPAGYVDADDPARSWWKNAAYPGLRAVAERTDAVEKPDTSGKWSFTAGEGGDA